MNAMVRRIVVYEVGLVMFFTAAYLVLRASGREGAFEYVVGVFTLLQSFILWPLLKRNREK